MIVTDDYDDNKISNCSNFGNEDNNINFKYLLLSIPSSILLFSLKSLMIYILIKPLINKKIMQTFLYPNHPVRCIIKGPSERGNSVFQQI